MGPAIALCLLLSQVNGTAGNLAAAPLPQAETLSETDAETLSETASRTPSEIESNAQSATQSALEAQEQRANAIARASQATVAVFEPSGAGGGSAVLISPDGFALTNFHVVMPCGPGMQCGLPDGRLYDAVLVGVDPVGDVALIQLLGRNDFPVAEIADSDQVRTGDWCFAAGNPFLLADDFRPTITYGIVSGVHRYQYPAETLLEYADCIQTDAAINPGNSGGPLFDAQGRLIGVNGRGSFEKRGRVNVGVGYAISINQIQRFMGHLKSGRIVDHASLGATVSTQDGSAVVDDILEDSDVYRRGLRFNDVIVQLGGREATSANALKNILGVYPPGWRVPVVYRRGAETFSTAVRLMGLHGDAELVDLIQQEASTPTDDETPPGRPQPGGDIPREQDNPEGDPDGDPRPNPHRRGDPSALQKPGATLPPSVAERYQARRGFANYWYNARQQQALWDAYVERSRLSDVGYRWKIVATLADGRAMRLETTERGAEIGLPAGDSRARFDLALADQLGPPGSGGFLVALRLWQQFLHKGLRQFGEVYYLGRLAAGPLAGDSAEAGPDLVPCDCLVGLSDGMEVRFLFDPSTGDLAGIELFPHDNVDPCEIWFSDFREIEGRRLPMRWRVRHGDRVFADFNVASWDVASTAQRADAPPAEEAH